MINTFKKHGLQPGCDRSPVRLALVGRVSWPEVHRGVREELRGFRGWCPWSQRSGGVACGGRSQRDKELLGEPGPWRDPVVTCFVGFKSLSHGHSWIEWFGGTYILGTICRLSMIDSRMGWSWWSWYDAHPSGQGGKVDRFGLREVIFGYIWCMVCTCFGVPGTCKEAMIIWTLLAAGFVWKQHTLKTRWWR